MKITLIVPVLNEQETIPIFYKTVKENSYLKNKNLELVFVDDGSSDGTDDILKALEITDKSIVYLSFTRNFGKEAALFAGLEIATGDVVIPIDVDLQDPLEVIPKMVAEWETGAQIVLAKRIDRSSDNFLKRLTAAAFYKIHNAISHPKIEANVGDFRLLSKEIVEQVILLDERNLFMKGILSWVGGKTAMVEYTRSKRIAGKTKFNGWKLWNFALEGITSFSTLPLRVWTYLGFFIAIISFLYGLWMIVNTLLWGNPIKGYPSLLVSILFLGGIQLIGIGVLGEYIGRIYIEAKKRPRYLLKNGFQSKNK